MYLYCRTVSIGHSDIYQSSYVNLSAYRNIMDYSLNIPISDRGERPASWGLGS